ncbi:MAG: FAD/NAD(P)-binding protein [Thermomonas sp.]
MSDASTRPADTIIVGGGASGVLVASQLLRRSCGRHRIAIVEPAPELARGAAYSTPHPGHLLNVVAGRMSAFEDRPDDFVRFLVDHDGGDAAAHSRRFAPRRDYGRYLRATLEAQPGSERIEWIRDAASGIGVRPDGVEVALASGERVRAGNLVLAIGNAPKHLAALAPERLPGLAQADAWDYASIAAIAPREDIAILGSGLSMVDVVVALADAGHQGRIHVVSRHGLLPLPHAEYGPHSGGVEALAKLGLPARMRLLREWVVEAQSAGQPWQWVMDRLRPHGAQLWQTLDDAGQRRFLRHAVRYWDIHRHRIAPRIHALVSGLLGSGQLQVHAGRLADIEPGERATLEIALRDGGRATLAVDRLVNATGIETQSARSPHPLVRALLASGAIAPGPHGIGLATDDDGRLRDRDGRVAPNAYTLGSARVGQLWESIAIPELRVQAEAIAGAILAHDG